jgi:hypothetical protein
LTNKARTGSKPLPQQTAFQSELLLAFLVGGARGDLQGHLLHRHVKVAVNNPQGMYQVLQQANAVDGLAHDLGKMHIEIAQEVLRLNPFPDDAFKERPQIARLVDAGSASFGFGRGRSLASTSGKRGSTLASNQ